LSFRSSPIIPTTAKMTETETKGSTDHILKTPQWVFFVHIAKALLALVILALAGYILSDVYFDEPALALAIVRNLLIALPLKSLP
jgi:hypothetical protein